MLGTLPSFKLRYYFLDCFLNSVTRFSTYLQICVGFIFAYLFSLSELLGVQFVSDNESYACSVVLALTKPILNALNAVLIAQVTKQ